MMAERFDAGFAHLHRLGHQPAAGDGRGDQVQQFIGFKRLEQIIVRAELGGLDGGFGRAVRGHQDDGQLRFGGVKLGHQFQSAQARQSQVGDDHAVLLPAGLFQTGIAPAGNIHLIVLLAQHLLQGGGSADVVFDQQNFRFHVH